MPEKILLVDDDPNILDGYKRNLRKKFDIDVALSGADALKMAAENGPFAVIVSDLRMPGMDGIEFLSSVRKLVPDTVRMMLSGNADMNDSIEAVNEGNVFRFLTKPCSVEKMSTFLDAGVEQYNLIKAEKDLLEGTLKGSVKVLVDILSLASPAAFGRATRLQRIMAGLADQLGVERKWEFELAGMLSQTGCVTLPNVVIDKIFSGQTLNVVETRMFESHPKIGHDLIANIPRLEEVANIILYQEKHYNGEGVPKDDVKGQDIPLGACALNLAIAYDTLMKSGKQVNEALREIQGNAHLFDPNMLEAFKKFVASEKQFTVETTDINNLVTGMIIAQDLMTSSGMLLITKGQTVTSTLRERLHNFAKAQEISGSVNVFVPVDDKIVFLA
jgi:response regulator RpfG family c-di-GMP phosphodiesterase